MAELRTTEQRKADVLAALGRNVDIWVATASAGGAPHVIAASTWWTGSELVIATIGTSRTARNLDAGGRARLVLGTPEDVILVDARVIASAPAEGSDLGVGFEAAAGWNPADEGPGWRFFRLAPVRIQAYRGYGETEGRDVMRGSAWLA